MDGAHAARQRFQAHLKADPEGALEAIGAVDVLPWLLSLSSGLVSVAQVAQRAIPALEGGPPGGARLESGAELATLDTNPLSHLEDHPEKAGNAVDLAGREIGEWVGAMDEAVQLIGEALPQLAVELSVTLMRVIPVGYDKEQHRSASFRQAPGLIYMTLHPDPVTMAAAIIHETQHGKLNMLSWVDPVLNNGMSEWTESPVRPDLRPLMGVLLAVHAFVPVAAFMARLRALDHPLAQTRMFGRRFTEVLASNERGMNTVREKGDFTPTGRRVFEALEALDAATREAGEHPAAAAARSD